jgi:dienelactone hydrolase
MLFWLLLGVLSAGFSAMAPAAEVERVEITLADGSSRKAFLGLPGGSGPFPGLVYQHGSVVREKGYSGAASRGYDLADFARAFAEKGFVTLAPLREAPEDCCNGDEALAEGMAASRAAARFLRGRKDVTGERLCLTGFSEGGLVTLWSLIRRDDYAKAVVMSPATMTGNRSRADTLNAKRLTRSGRVKEIAEPMLFTVGDADPRNIRRSVRRLSRASGSRAITYEGDHRSFTTPRPAVIEAAADFCRK